MLQFEEGNQPLVVLVSMISTKSRSRCIVSSVLVAGLLANLAASTFIVKPTPPQPERCICVANECNFQPKEFRYECPNGNIEDSCGCVTSCQCADCPAVNKSLSCPGGRRKDANNCPLNECEECICPANDCGLFLPPDLRYVCPTGNIIDGCGCVTSCQCAGCPAVNSSLSCPGGRRKDINGCPLNECEECICPANDCGLFLPPDLRYVCPTGNIIDGCGCVTSCQCAGCPAVNSSLSCPGGRRKDLKGCPLNECEECICPANECGLFLPPDLKYDCPTGNIIDGCGCVTNCQCAGCPAVDQALSCSGGRRKDANDCPLNECNSPPTIKPGSCPRFGAWGTVPCVHDSDCSGHRKCCHFLRNRYYCNRVTQDFTWNTK